ncbi:hypothetical protein GCM10009839_49010 [Catenulispora yoronensis]|uniref:Pyrrolo-quinoline quinone repeat domain-containing protein n=1 Tax=Catenulispora yoronensis TaxID=450799 RepID=A0ABP5G666_9ACTN
MSTSPEDQRPNQTPRWGQPEQSPGAPQPQPWRPEPAPGSQGGQGGGNQGPNPGQGQGQNQGQNQGQSQGQSRPQNPAPAWGPAGPGGPGPQGGPGRTPPPFVQQPGPTSTGTTIPPVAPTGQEWGARNETFFLPPQFSYNPDQKLPDPPTLVEPKRSRKRLIMAITGAVVLLAGAAGGVWVVTSHSKSDNRSGTDTTGGTLIPDEHTASPAAAGLKPAWQAKADGLGPDAKTVVGTWLADGHTIVRGDATGLQAYDAETGNALWTYSVPDQGSKICDMSRQANQKIGVVRYGPSGGCTTIAAIDTGTGKALWTTQIPGGTKNPALSATDGAVAATAGTMLTVWNAADGKKLWDLDLSVSTPVCRMIQAEVQDTIAALLADCGKGPEVLMKAVTTGADLWQAPIPPDNVPVAQYTLVRATAPTIVHVEATPDGAAPVDHYYTINDRGLIQSTIEGIGPFGTLDPRVGPAHQTHQAAYVAGTTLILPTAAKNAAGAAPAAGLVAFDYVSGKQLWQTDPMDGAPVAIVSMDETQTVVYDSGNSKTGPGAHLVALKTVGGATAAAPLKDAIGHDVSGPVTAYLAGDRLVVVPATPQKGAAILAYGVQAQ